MGSTILLVDDDQHVLDLLSRYLQHEEHAVLTATNGSEALRLAYHERPDLVVMDLMMPGMDGWELVSRLRQLADFPIIVLSARSAETDKLRSFRQGVDDYVAKPFSLGELGARIQAVLARQQSRSVPVGALYASGDLVVDIDKRRVRRGSEVIPLTPTEFRLLECLIRKRGQPVSEQSLAQEVWGLQAPSDTGIVRRFIWLLRQKLEDDPEHPTRILTARGFGYRLGTAPLTPPKSQNAGAS